MHPADGVAAIEVGDGAGNPQDAVIAAGGEAVLLGGLVEQGFTGPVRGGSVFQ